MTQCGALGVKHPTHLWEQPNGFQSKEGRAPTRQPPEYETQVFLLATALDGLRVGGWVGAQEEIPKYCPWVSTSLTYLKNVLSCLPVMDFHQLVRLFSTGSPVDLWVNSAKLKELA